MASKKKINVGKKPLPSKKEVEEIEPEDDIISAISEMSDDIDFDDLDTEDMILDEDAEDKIEEYLEGAPAIIHSNLQPVEVNDDYPTANHVYCRTKASKTHREIAPENNHTLIIREKK